MVGDALALAELHRTALPDGGNPVGRRPHRGDKGDADYASSKDLQLEHTGWLASLEFDRAEVPKASPLANALHVAA